MWGSGFLISPVLEEVILFSFVLVFMSLFHLLIDMASVSRVQDVYCCIISSRMLLWTGTLKEIVSQTD